MIGRFFAKQKTGRSSRDSICLFYKLMTENGNRWKAKRELQHIAISPQPFNHHIPIILLDEQNIVLSPQNVFLETFVRQDDVLKALVFGIYTAEHVFLTDGCQRGATQQNVLEETGPHLWQFFTEIAFEKRNAFVDIICRCATLQEGAIVNTIERRCDALPKLFEHESIGAFRIV